MHFSLGPVGWKQCRAAELAAAAQGLLSEAHHRCAPIFMLLRELG